MKNYLPEGNVETPFNPQLEHFDFICGSIKNENKILRIISILAGVSFLASVGLCYYAVTQPDAIPIIITLDDLGRTNYVGQLTRSNWQNYDVPENAITAKVKEFIELYFFISTDETVMRRNIQNSYHNLTNRTAQKYTSMLETDKPYDDFGSCTQEVTYDTEPLTVSDKTYQIDFHVIKRELSGRQKSDTYYRALVTIELMKPPEEDLYVNPLGIYISSFDFKILKENKGAGK